MPQVLIVDGAGTARDAVERTLSAAGHLVSFADDPHKALEAWQAVRHEVVVLSEGKGAPAAVEVALRMKALAPGGFQSVLLLVERGGVAERVLALQTADDVLTRPYEPAELAARVEALLRTRRIVDELRAARAESERTAGTDPITGLRSRVVLTERINEEWKRSLRYSDPLSLLLLAVDDWRSLEPRGPAFSERVLQGVAGCAFKSLRQFDVVARYGANELAALLPKTHFAGSLTCAARLHAEVAKCRIDDVSPTVSMGVAFYPGREVTEAADLSRVAQRALDRAREEGPGNICLFQHQGYLFHPR